MTPPVIVVGIGEDGLDGLPSAVRALIEGAEVLAGGSRHLAMIPISNAERIDWNTGFGAAMAAIDAARGRRVVVLASGDPLWHGVGSALLKRFAPEDLRFVPAPGAFALAAARMRWPLAETTTLSLHAAAPECLRLHLAPGARLLVLGRDGGSPAAIARLLCAAGFGPSTVTVLERMGGPAERRSAFPATDGAGRSFDSLSTVAVACAPGPDWRPLARVPGLPDDAFETDGLLTKREVRAITLSALAPRPGETLWDVGAGSGSVAIEWLRADCRNRAVAIERDPDRAARVARNALALGVPGLEIVAGRAPAVFPEIAAAPDCLFVGGGLTTDGLIEQAWDRLPAGGRLVANAVTLEGAARLAVARARWGGELIRVGIERAGAIGAFTAWEPRPPVIQYAVTKP